MLLFSSIMHEFDKPKHKKGGTPAASRRSVPLILNYKIDGLLVTPSAQSLIEGYDALNLGRAVGHLIQFAAQITLLS